MATAQTIPAVRPGDVMSAEWAERVRAAIEALGGGDVPGNLMQSVIAGVLAALAPERFIPVKIMAVNIATGGGGGSAVDGAYWPSDVRYDLRGIAKPGINLTAQTPWYGREVRNDEARVYPARVGDTALIELEYDGEGTHRARLMLLPGSEVVARKRCA